MICLSTVGGLIIKELLFHKLLFTNTGDVFFWQPCTFLLLPETNQKKAAWMVIKKEKEKSRGLIAQLTFTVLSG